MEPKNRYDIYKPSENYKITIIPSDYNNLIRTYHTPIKTPDEILDELDIQVIEKYLRRKKLQKLEGSNNGI